MLCSGFSVEPAAGATPAASSAAVSGTADPEQVRVRRARAVVATEMSTAALVEAAQRREKGAWDELVVRYSRLVRRVVATYRLQQADAADAVQNTWVRALERLDSIRDPERLGGWLATTADRECLALLRRAQREIPDDRAASDHVAVVPGPEAQVVGAEARQAVDAAVAELPGRRQRLVQALFYEPELPYAEVSEMVGIPVGSIGPTRGRALRNLRCSLERAGFGAEPREALVAG
jgi:RNA polymerase sigma factor (sigma-70 family)